MPDFQTDLRRGRRFGQMVYAAYRSQGLRVAPSDGHTDWVFGIDATLYRDGEQHATIQVKGDERAADTGNLFLETVSVEHAGLEGGSFDTQAEWIIYVLPHLTVGWVFWTDQLQAAVREWQKHYPERQVQNDGWVTLGIAVPLHVVDRVVHHRIRLGGVT